MAANPGKFQIMFLWSNINNSKITFMTESKRVKSRSDDKLSFTTHIKTYAAQQVTVCEL